MIMLTEDYLVFRDASGEGLPYSADMISVELVGDSATLFDPEFVKQAAAAVFHYFRKELGRESVTMAEFSEALEKILRGFSLAATVTTIPDVPAPPRIVQSDLSQLVAGADGNCELIFFPRLRDELRTRLRQEPQMLCFQGIRPCVKQLIGARRWSDRCQGLHDQIVEFLRSCMSCETSATCALVVK
jgi:hypothetical protein